MIILFQYSKSPGYHFFCWGYCMWLTQGIHSFHIYWTISTILLMQLSLVKSICCLWIWLRRSEYNTLWLQSHQLLFLLTSGFEVIWWSCDSLCVLLVLSFSCSDAPCKKLNLCPERWPNYQNACQHRTIN